MPQPFQPPSLLLVKLALIAIAVAMVALRAYGLLWAPSQGVPVDSMNTQPIPFSHKHHAGDDELDWPHVPRERRSRGHLGHVLSRSLREESGLTRAVALVGVVALRVLGSLSLVDFGPRRTDEVVRYRTPQWVPAVLAQRHHAWPDARPAGERP